MPGQEKSRSDHAAIAEPHFVRDYRRFVGDLLANFDLDEAMSHAVGGDYAGVGAIERSIVTYAGLKSGMSLVDIGCGSGRLSTTLADLDIRYLGTDVVQALLDYAKARTPRHFEFVCHTELTIPTETSSINMISIFSVFTHLLHAESFLYMTDALRALKSGGILIFSFLEFANTAHWPAFEHTLQYYKTGQPPHLNMFIERDVIRLWAQRIGFIVQEIIDGLDARFDGKALGQSMAILRKP